VFERLFRALVTDRARVRETACCACGAEACRFEIGTGGQDGRRLRRP
jgi:divinyl protochlorophyllide a 8-vinyl-reductase